MSRAVTTSARKPHIESLRGHRGQVACDFGAMERVRTEKKTHASEDAPAVGPQRPSRSEDSPRFVRVLGQRGLLPISGDKQQRIAAIARVQRGLVTRQQLLAAGLHSSTITNMINRALLRVEHSGVYAVAYAPPVPLARETAALLACGGRAVLSPRSAGGLWGLASFPDGPV